MSPLQGVNLFCRSIVYPFFVCLLYPDYNSSRLVIDICSARQNMVETGMGCGRMSLGGYSLVTKPSDCEGSCRRFLRTFSKVLLKKCASSSQLSVP